MAALFTSGSNRSGEFTPPLGQMVTSPGRFGRFFFTLLQ
jgi:hypothetical protein